MAPSKRATYQIVFFSMRISSNPAGFTKGAVPAAEGKKANRLNFNFFEWFSGFAICIFDAWLPMMREAKVALWSQSTICYKMSEARGTSLKKWILVSAWKKNSFFLNTWAADATQKDLQATNGSWAALFCRRFNYFYLRRHNNQDRLSRHHRLRSFNKAVPLWRHCASLLGIFSLSVLHCVKPNIRD